MAKGITVTEHILAKQREKPEATGAFTALLAELTVAAKVIAQKVNKANLTEDSHVGHLACMASKTNTDLIPIPPKYSKGDYILVFDPLGGVTNIDVHIDVGMVFSILKKTDTSDMSLMTSVLQPGRRQVAAGYFIYGSSTMMVFSSLPRKHTDTRKRKDV